ncbi:phospho-sugar mutase [Kitasatospora purpeofusca]|uniref:phospho-sugar mutase n=1 Tax=Kitasatospora purpeofusca TaxID=67352 RepID=UPI00224E6238|nr:phospho-sugar mutase [Kitasatospora purpeofusca]MCX4753169.1 phospho-sugar mutase [Kitasatospora purpeofusca]WSR32693.1 phospho-sugar mutase [Kitasatospora purpeofusca]WSR40785.1 phospho-sugar mutase [Kitasatospora purpeofusca]
MTQATTTDLLARARTWLAEDPDPQTREELAALLADAETPDADANAKLAWSELADRFADRLQFGTAGLRGELGAGPMRMNRAVVIRAAAGLVAYVKRQGLGDLVVIGYDARHKSYDFARDTAAVVVGAGLRALLFPRPLPTPVLAFAVRHLGAAAGVTVTASHNPPQDNGYKVYLGDGSQIVPPADAGIAAEIDAIGSLTEVPLAADGWETVDESVVEAYLDRAASIVDPHSARELDIVYTPMHGVGRDTFLAAVDRAGFPAPTVVAEQAEPDPDFPTVAFPNPEEPGAMDLAFRTAAEARPDIVIANDPDADRCAVAVPADGGDGWRMLRGDEVGALLGAALVSKRAVGTFATTIVSSTLLGRIAEAAGLGYAETLTGFKWISRAGGLRYGYEEALGYCVDPEGVRDKDGITAALLVAELAATLKRSGRTLTDLLDDLALEHGLHATDQLSVRVEDLSVIADAMRTLRERPPTTLAGLTVARADDLAAGSAELPPTDGLRYYLAGDAVRSARIVVRPSGTEPKLKCYLEVVLPVASAADLADTRARAAELLATVKRDLAAAAGIDG